MNIQNNMSKITAKILFLLFGLIIFSCSSDDEPVATNEKLVSSLKFTSSTHSQLSDRITIAESTTFPGISELIQYLEHDITIYVITYKTTYKGEEIIASGLVSFPETGEAVPMMSFQHGTIASHNEAPTVDKNTYTFLSSVASAGYIFLIPDFIGFGSSSDVLHPYYHEDLTASSVVDMMKAAKELASQKEYNFDGRVFLSGYSEGGYATMATHKSLEENPVDGFELIASAPSSGGYDIKGMQEYFFGLTTYHQPFFIAYVALSYQSLYDWSFSLSDMFKEPYVSKLEGYFDGSMTGQQINSQLTDVLADYLKPDIIANIDTDSKYTDIVNALNENSTHNWTPTKRMMLYHGTEDITVPYQNSVDTYDKMMELGASGEVVTFTPLTGHTHGTGFFPYLYDFMEKFDDLK